MYQELKMITVTCDVAQNYMTSWKDKCSGYRLKSGVIVSTKKKKFFPQPPPLSKKKRERIPPPLLNKKTGEK